MNVTIFKELTTTEHLDRLEIESEQYIGLYVDMEDAEQRKYVKDKAYDIKQMNKAIISGAITKIKQARSLIKEEELYILNRTAKINEPFTLLIDGYDAERKVILDAKKASKLAIENAAQKLIDHEFALLIDKSYLADKLAAEKAQAEHDEAIRIDATNRATQAAKNAQEVTDRAIKLDAANRLKNREHVRSINRDILHTLIESGLSEYHGMIVISLASQGKLPKITINY